MSLQCTQQLIKQGGSRGPLHVMRVLNENSQTTLHNRIISLHLPDLHSDKELKSKVKTQTALSFLSLSSSVSCQSSSPYMPRNTWQASLKVVLLLLGSLFVLCRKYHLPSPLQNGGMRRMLVSVFSSKGLRLKIHF